MVMLGTCNDLFAAAVPDKMIEKILAHCCQYPTTTYRFQTKNPARYANFLSLMPPKRILGTTAETNRPTPNVSTAPAPLARLAAMAQYKSTIRARDLATAMKKQNAFTLTRINIEPVMQFDLDKFFPALRAANPGEILIGPDTKNSNLPQPGKGEVDILITALEATNITVYLKRKISRLVLPATLAGRTLIG